MAEAQSTYDTLLLLKAAALVGSTAAGSLIVDIGAGHARGDVVIDITAIETATGDELYTILVEGSDSADFSAGTPLITPLAVLFVGAGAVIPAAGLTTSTVGRYILPYRNEVNGHNFRYVRIHTVVAGTIATGINYSAFIGKERT